MTAIEKQQAEAQLDYALRMIAGSSDAIIAAHCDLGIPMEDAICAKVRHALRARASDAGDQLKLSFLSSQAATKGGRS